MSGYEASTSGSAKKKKITGSDLVAEIAADLDFPSNEVTAIVKRMVSGIADHLSNGESISLSQYGLGQFNVVQGASRRGRNMMTGESVVIPARLRVKFNPVKRLRNLDKINGKKD